MTGTLIGVDSGGSKTLALVSDLAGNVLGRGFAGPSNYHSVGAEAAYAALDAAIREAYQTAGMPFSPKAICLGLGGVDRPEDFAIIQRWAAERYPGVPLEIVNDARLVLAAGTPAGWGIAIISGTGSIVIGRHPDGRTGRAGGWGYLFGDEGSGYALGLAALRAVACAADGRGPQTALTEGVLAFWQLSKPSDLVRRVYGMAQPRPEIARLAEVVEAACAANDPAACAIVRQAGQDLALATQAVMRALGFAIATPHAATATPCALAGSLLVKGAHTPAAFRQASAALGLLLEPLTPVPEPALGAIRLAQNLAR
jgi:N-acetylglucosamine kinase-like BadF-type ATPase